MVILPETLPGCELPTDITADSVGIYKLKPIVGDGELSSFDELSMILSAAPVGGDQVLTGISGYWRWDENACPL